MLKNGRSAIGIAEFVPAHTAAGSGLHRVVEHNGLVVAKVAVGHAEVGHIADGGEQLCRVRLRDATASRTKPVERGHRDTGRTCERGIGGRGKIDVELEHEQRCKVPAQTDKEVRLSRRRRRAAIHVSRKHGTRCLRNSYLKTNRLQRPADQRRIAVNGAEITVYQPAVVYLVEFISGKIIGIGPDAELWEIVQVAAEGNGIAVIAAGGVGTGGNGKALEVLGIAGDQN